MKQKDILIKFYTWNAKRDVEKVIETIHSALKKLLPFDFKIKYTDLAFYQAKYEDEFSIVFGNTAASLIKDTHKEVIILPKYEILLDDKNIKERKEASKKLIDFSKRIKQSFECEEEANVLAEINNKTIGKENSDIIITPKELDYAMKLKKLLPESKVVIRKGDLIIEAK